MAARVALKPVQLELPDELRFLFEPARYKVAHGGRGSAKSWSFARALLTIGTLRPLRILCAREVQRSIKQSVHTLLADQIVALGLEGFYDVQDQVIKGRNGTEFTFTGLNVLTVDSIKSFEGVDIVWVEEGQAVRERSWKILIPTIRKPNSEIWVSFNPDLDTDATYVRFVENPPEGFVVRVNYTDNPWFPAVLEKERRRDKQMLPRDEYENIWDGKCRVAVEGAIFAREIRDAIAQGRVTLIPYEPRLKVHVVCDLGFNDYMFIALVQRDQSALRIIYTLQDNLRTLDSYSGELKEMRLNWGTWWLPPTDGDAGNIASGGVTAKQILEKLGWTCRLVPEVGKETGIRYARVMFPRVYFHKPYTGPLVSALKRYRRNIHVKTNEPLKPLHDEASHGGDCFRYICVASDLMENEDWLPPPTPGFKPLDPTMAY